MYGIAKIFLTILNLDLDETKKMNIFCSKQFFNDAVS